MRSRAADALLFAGLLLAAVGAAAPSWAQTKTARLGMLLFTKATLEEQWYAAFNLELARRGWVPGKNLVLEHRFARGDELQFDEPAKELAGLKIDAILAASAPAIRAAAAATQTIPIVGQDYTNDPIAAGYAESYSRPGKNVTGVFLDAPEFAGKWIELLRAIVPRLKRVGILWDPAPGDLHLNAVTRVARSMGVQAQVQEVRAPGDFDKAFAAFRGRVQALVVLPSPMTWNNSERLAELAVKHRLPATAVARRFADAGGAISYGPDFTETVMRNAAQVAKILDGAKPGDLPIERPTKFQFVLNLKTIKALGLTVPEYELYRADEVIR